MTEILQIKLKQNEIKRKRDEISKNLKINSINIKDNKINSISPYDLGVLFKLYDEIFFGSWFQECFRGKMKFSLSRRMTKSAGLTLCPKNPDKLEPQELIIEIRIGIDLFFQYDSIEGNKVVCGIKTNNSLDALQLVFEHELCHVIEYINYFKSDCKGERFKDLAKNIFGHTESNHMLPTYSQIAKERLGLKIGDVVTFDIEGRNEKGTIININKRATVMVKNSKGSYTDSMGNRYHKFYVPLSLLNR